MNAPLLRVIGDPGPDLDEPPDQPLDGPPGLRAFDVEPAEHVKQVAIIKNIFFMAGEGRKNGS